LRSRNRNGLVERETQLNDIIKELKATIKLFELNKVPKKRKKGKITEKEALGGKNSKEAMKEFVTR